MITNKQLVDFASMALTEKWGYVWGTFGQILTGDLLAQKIRQYPGGVGTYAEFIQHNWVGRKTVDCVGLIKAAYWSESGGLMYNSTTDVSADGMFERASEKGTIDTLPEIPGVCVWHPGHIGVYIGNGQVIEAHGTKYGVIQTKMNDTGWTHWLKCPYIEYLKEVKYMVPADFDEAIYLKLNPDVAEAVTQGLYGLKSGAQHYASIGKDEGREYKEYKYWVKSEMFYGEFINAAPYEPYFKISTPNGTKFYASPVAENTLYFATPYISKEESLALIDKCNSEGLIVRLVTE